VARRIVHVITGLPIGGSQTMLAKLVSRMDPKAWSPIVISLRDKGEVGERLEAAGIPVRALEMRESPSDLGAVARLARWLRELRPAIVQTWLYHADLFGGFAAGWAGGFPVIWNIRQSAVDPRIHRFTTIWIARLCARLSRRLPKRIVCCSETARRAHADFGYDASRMVVIPNGFDIDAFQPDPAARDSVRREFHLAPDTLLIGLVARFHPAKDHENFVEAARRLGGPRPGVHFLLCGEGVDERNEALRGWLDRSGIRNRFHLLGPRADIARVLASLDIASLSSADEGFPNVIGEAMACGVPCVATDVGECADIVGNTGRLVPRRDPAALAAAWQELIDAGTLERSRLAADARRRVERYFTLPSVVERYQSLYECVADPSAMDLGRKSPFEN
jgi:glycosyltransferase involved in cell wall biosynthesis